jgi:hypothetical protein
LEALKAFRPPGIRAYIDLAINKRPATARAYSAKDVGVVFRPNQADTKSVGLVMADARDREQGVM